MTRTIMQHILCFRELSPIFSMTYGVSCFTYNFGFLHDCVIALDKFLAYGWPTGDFNMANSYVAYFD